MVIGPTPAGVGRDHAGDLTHGVEIDIADEAVAGLCRGVLDSVYSHVNHDGTGLDHVTLDEVGLAHRGDDNVGAAAVTDDVAACVSGAA